MYFSSTSENTHRFVGKLGFRSGMRALRNPSLPTKRCVFSDVEDTHRFVGKLGFRSARIPLRPKEAPLAVDEEYVLLVPTYGGGSVKGAVPKQVIKFHNDSHNRSL